MGILGGTFDPPHNGHIRAALVAAQELGLDRVLLIPTNIPPHKQAGSNKASACQRLDMTRLAINGHENLAVDGREIARGGKSFTILTVFELKDEYKNAEIWFICGTDMFLTVQNWHRAQELLNEVAFAVVPRAAGDLEKLSKHKLFLEEKYGAKVKIIACQPLDISSSAIRQKDASALVPQGVYDYIEKNGLYLPTEKGCNFR